MGHPQDEYIKEICAYIASYLAHIREDWNLSNNTFKSNTYEMTCVMKEMFVQIISAMNVVIDGNKPYSQQIWISWCEKYWSFFFMLRQISNHGYRHPSTPAGEGLPDSS
jgi:hypothetical protein